MNEQIDLLPRVLIVDDDVELLDELREGLAGLGMPVRTADKAEQALAIVRQHDEIRLVVTDLQMPHIDGIELLQKLQMRRRKHPIAAIVITGHASLDRAVGALRMHAVDFLQKPLIAEEVAHAIKRALSLLEDEGSAEEQVPSASIASPNYLKALVAARADRDAIFQSGLFSDPAWDMMLDLAVAEATGRPISVTSLCIASGVPTTTALRRIDDLKDAGLVDRAPDPRDKRRILVNLTDQGRERMQAFVRRQAGRFGITLD